MAVQSPREGWQSHVVDLRVRAPDAAPGHADFELARQVVKIAVADQQLGRLLDQRGGVANLFCVDSGEWAAGAVARVVSAGAHRGQAHAPQGLENLGTRPEPDPAAL